MYSRSRSSRLLMTLRYSRNREIKPISAAPTRLQVAADECGEGFAERVRDCWHGSAAITSDRADQKHSIGSHRIRNTIETAEGPSVPGARGQERDDRRETLTCSVG